MFLVNFLATLLLIYIAVRVLWMIFGRRLAVFAVRRFAKRLEDEMLRQQSQATSGPGRQAGTEEVFINRNVKVRFPKQAKKQKRPENLSELAEDVEFEDLN